MKRRAFSFIVGAACAVFPGIAALAQNNDSAGFPSQPIQIVLPFPPGGNSDLIARILAERLQSALRSPVIVTSRPGAGTRIGAAFVANSKADGYTMLISSPASFVANQFIYANLPYDPDTAFSPVSLVAEFPNVMVAPPSLGITSIRHLIERAKAEPGKLAYASSGTGTTSHLAGALFTQMANVEMLHVPYKGTSQSVQDLVAGRVGMTIDNLGPLYPFIQAGQLAALGVSTSRPVSLLPDVPPIAAVLEGYALSSWNVLALPAATPRDIVAKVSAECDRILRTPDVAEKFASFGSRPVGGTPEDTAAFLKEERMRWEAAVKAAKITKGQFD
ncbi:MAG: tripartite tricarboxylate transporter substrate binding protein [Alphaproteobacteria bacterium]|nr:tripartite tricarboxylate transporter substrate binding protein [Alphaproteobacteria bacterium]